MPDMLEEIYDKSYPRFLLFGKGKQPLPEGIIPPSTRTPRYGLGWMIRVPGIKNHFPGYMNFMLDVTWPAWRSNNFKPAKLSEMSRIGLQIPQFWEVGENYVFLYIAWNHPVMMTVLKFEKNRGVLVRQALGALGLAPGCFEPLSAMNLIWLRWDKGARFSDAEYPCIGEHLWVLGSGAVRRRPGSAQSGVERTLTPVPKELGALIQCRYPPRGTVATTTVPSLEVAPEEAK
ncbi:hypothetical protein D9611_011340 [Ephemerocybe angulata]|uniref:Uncharacterized protein n=1 Tax=Ephemerocybe angulata TaxID=980116 RepID=A0A8H5F1R4_9AGAR|nr:hypothetical protein D9611_011340 [Tulosesus angulatus]